VHRTGCGRRTGARSEICWAVVTPDDRFAFANNFADGAVSRFAIDPDGSLSLEDATAGISVEGKPGLRDEDLSGDGRFLYAIDADGGLIYGWSEGAEGSLERSGRGRACRRRWPGSRLAEAVAGFVSSYSTRSPSRRRRPGAWRSPQTPVPKDAASCWPRGAPPGALGPLPRGQLPRRRTGARARVPRGARDRRRRGPVRVAGAGGAHRLRHAATAQRPRAYDRRPLLPWLNDRVCAVEGEVRPRTDGPGFEVVFEVSEMVWEGVP
jgi:hypothetical protein